MDTFAFIMLAPYGFILIPKNHVYPKLLYLFDRDHFYQFGEIRSITMVSRQQCAFVQFTTRTSAENAAEKSFNKLIMQVRVFFLSYQCAVKEEVFVKFNFQAFSSAYLVSHVIMTFCKT